MKAMLRGLGLLLAGSAAVALGMLVASVVVGTAFLWAADGADPWSLVRDMGLARTMVVTSMAGLLFVAGELGAALASSGTAGRAEVVAVTAGLATLWMIAKRRRRASWPTA